MDYNHDMFPILLFNPSFRGDYFYLTSISKAIMPGESADSEPIMTSEDAPTKGFNMGKYLVRRPRPEA